MYLDKENEFSDAQAVTATAISENVIDLGATNTLKDIGAGEEVWLVVRTRTAATDATSDATLAVSLESDSTADLATSATTHFTTSALAFADLSPAGTVLAAVRLPPGEYEPTLVVRYPLTPAPPPPGPPA